jgi:S1-C subfamily serine protease
VRSDGRSGGTGVIVNSSFKESSILTNGHVCEVVKNGGLVITTEEKKYQVISYKQSLTHDLCLIKVNANLHAAAKLASNSPTMFEAATISGHPSLLPNVRTTGHFSAGRIIQVMTGFRDCTPEDAKNPNPGVQFMCGLFGKLPVVKSYDTTVVTATIMPGSSGSGVYNSNDELSGLVFAGSGGIGYAFIVPYEYVAYFLTEEVKTLETKTPSYVLSLDDLFSKQTKEDETNLKIKKACATPVNQDQEEVCNIINRSLM